MGMVVSVGLWALATVALYFAFGALGVLAGVLGFWPVYTFAGDFFRYRL
jgi:hypothetical protein